MARIAAKTPALPEPLLCIVQVVSTSYCELCYTHERCMYTSDGSAEDSDLEGGPTCASAAWCETNCWSAISMWKGLSN